MMNIKQNLSYWLCFILDKVWNYLSRNLEIYKAVLVAFPTSYLVERCLLNYLSLRIYYNIMYL